MPHAELSFDSGESSLSVRRFSIHEAVSQPFTLSVWARSENPAIDLGEIVGQPAGLRITAGYANVAGGGARVWSGLCSYMELVRAERRSFADEQSTYYLRIVPTLWLTTHRSGNRIFQHLSVPEIVEKVLKEWRVEHTFRIEPGQYPRHEYRVQYGESDFVFLSRLLEEAGIAYTFEDDGTSTLVLSDALHRNDRRPGPPIPYEHNPTQAAQREFVSRVELVRSVRPGALTLRDHDHRNPAFPLFAEAPKAAAPESRYEQYHHLPGGMLVETGRAGDTPNADDKGVARHDLAHGQKRAARMLESLRVDRAGLAFESNVTDLAPGVVFSIDNHPHPDTGKDVLVVSTIIEGSAEGEWGVYGHAVFNNVPYRPPLTTPRPNVRGVQVARVVGPVDEEIHTDEYGRIRVQFPWDREGAFDDGSSCWMRVGEGWGGEAYGWIDIPRVGHEVLVSYVEGDPDRPVITGRAYNAVNPVPYVLPDHKTVSTWKSRSYPSADGGWYNEIKLEDNAGDELFYIQAQKDMRVLVKNDESITVGRDRYKHVAGEEEEITGASRTQIVGVDRERITALNQTAVIAGKKVERVVGDEREQTERSRMLLVKKSQDVVVKGTRRERVEYDQHLQVVGDRVEHVQKKRSLLVLEEKHERVGQDYARDSGREDHVVAGEELVGEASDITFKGPGGFVRIDASGITISGTFVKINVSGSPGHGHGSSPAEPEEAKEAMIPAGRWQDAGSGQGHAIPEALRERLRPRAQDPSPAWAGVVRRYAHGTIGDVSIVADEVPLSASSLLREEVLRLRAGREVTSILFLAVRRDPVSGALVDAGGDPLPPGAEPVLGPVAAGEVLALPALPEVRAVTGAAAAAAAGGVAAAAGGARSPHYERFVSGVLAEGPDAPESLDVEALLALDAAERRAAEDLLVERIETVDDWRAPPALAALRTKRAVRPMKARLGEARGRMKIALARALVALDALPRLDETVVEMLESKDPEEGIIALAASAGLASRPILGALARASVHHPAPEVRVNAGAALVAMARLGDDPLVWRFRPRYLPLGEDDEKVRREAFADICQLTELWPEIADQAVDPAEEVP